MNQFDVFQLDHLKVIVLQHPFAETTTVVVAPLLTKSQVRKPIGGLLPEVVIDGEPLFVDIPALAGIKRSLLRRCVGNLDSERLAIMSALDLLFSGF